MATEVTQEAPPAPPSEPEEEEKRFGLSAMQTAALAAVCIAAVGVRLAFAKAYLPRLESDFYWYRIAGLAAADHGVLSLFSPNPPVPMWVLSLWPPGYFVFLGLLYSVHTGIWVAPVAQAVLAGLSCLLLFAAARRWEGNPWLAAGIMAFYPQAIVYSAIHGSEVLALFFMCLAILASVTPLRDRQAFVYGAALGLGTLTRVHTMLAVPGILTSLWRRRSTLALILICFVLVILPWSISRSLVYHRPVFMTTFLGHLLYMGNHVSNPTGGYYEVPRPVEIPGDVTPSEEDVYFAAAGIREIMLHPLHYLMVSARRLLMWTGVERDEWVEKYAPRWFAGLALLSQIALFLVALIAGVQVWREPRARFVLQPALSLLLLTALTYHMPRYTLASLPYFAIIASRLRTDWTS